MRLSSAFLAALPLAALVAVAVVSTRSSAEPSGSPGERRTVVVELFSSEGCSSCPPADAVLARLARDQPVPGAEVVALELHVDYWNQLGWADPFSSAAFSARQRAYADASGRRGVYTPQAVIDGAAELVGSNEPGVRAAVASAAREAKAKVLVTRSGDRVAIAISDLAEAAEPADVWLAITEDGLTTAVPRGENAGATLAHGPVVRSLDRVGEIAAGTHGVVRLGEVEVAVKPGWRREALRAVAFVQERRSMRITGAGTTELR
jgi:hypothetical protein